MPEQPKKRPRGRWAYVNDFQPTVTGEMIYVGAHYQYADETRLPRKKLLLRLGAAAGLSVLAALVQGFLPVPSMRGCAYVLLPYAGELFSAISVLWAVVRLSLNREPLRAYVYNVTAAALGWRMRLCAACSGVTLAGQAVYLFLHGAEPAGIGFLALSAAALAGALAGLGLRRGAHWEKTEQ